MRFGRPIYSTMRRSIGGVRGIRLTNARSANLLKSSRRRFR